MPDAIGVPPAFVETKTEDDSFLFRVVNADMLLQGQFQEFRQRVDAMTIDDFCTDICTTVAGNHDNAPFEILTLLSNWNWRVRFYTEPDDSSSLEELIRNYNMFCKTGKHETCWFKLLDIYIGHC